MSIHEKAVVESLIIVLEGLMGLVQDQTLLHELYALKVRLKKLLD